MHVETKKSSTKLSKVLNRNKEKDMPPPELVKRCLDKEATKQVFVIDLLIFPKSQARLIPTKCRP